MMELALQKRPGRPYQFEHTKALNVALELFWKFGFEGTSLNDLTAAMGINRPSLYGAFGNKVALFDLCIKTYVEQHLGFIDEAIEKPSLTETFEHMFQSQIELMTKGEANKGCFIVQGILNCAEEHIEVKQSLIDVRKTIEGKLRKRIQMAQMKKEIESGISPAAFAKTVTTLYTGLSVQAVSGATKKELQEVANLAKKLLS